MTDSIPAIRFKDVSKKFGAVYANRNVSFDILRGKIHALIGENGAGKSTIMKILFGFYSADSGEMEVFGNRFQPNDPTDAVSVGIGMVHQHFMLIPTMTVIDNIILGHEQSDAFGQLELKKSAEAVLQFSKKYNMPIEPFETVSNLSVGQKQRVEIIKALYRGAEVLILDEPTAVLTPTEVYDFFNVLRQLKQENKTIIIITHKLEEVLLASDRVTVMRAGQVVGETDTNKTDAKNLAGMMIGRDFLLETPEKSKPHERRVVEIQNLSGKSEADHALNDVELHIKEGEILGVAGVSGNGQTTLEETINGSLPIISGSIALNGEDINRLNVRERKKKKIAHVSSDREKFGFISSFTNEDNLYVGYHFLDKFSSNLGFLKKDSIRQFARDSIIQFDVRPQDQSVQTGNLSGGNKQKVVIAREFSQDPKFLIVAEPTRGVDIGAIEYIHKYILKLKQEGKAILLISSDLSEICSLSDRACVMFEGKIAGYFDPSNMNENEVGLMMSGGKSSYRA